MLEIDLTFLSQIDPTVLRIVGIALVSLLGLLFLFFIVKVFFWFWLPIKQKKYVDSFDYVLLAIDVPKENIQSPKAVEHLFTSFLGTYAGPTKLEKYRDGAVPSLPLSFEIISIDGYIQFLVRIPVMFRAVTEAAIFSQYPDAQITEVLDYVTAVPQKFPDDTYDVWGTNFTLLKEDPYPIRTYQYFEHQLSQEFKDPMAAFLEQFAQLGKGEQAWFQITVSAILPKSWEAKGQKLVKKLIGEKVEHKKTIVEKLTDPLLNFFGWAADNIVIQAEAQAAEAKKSEPVNKMQNLTPGEQLVLTAIQTKLSKISFKTQIRFMYMAPKTVYNLAKGVSGPMGALSQFASVDMNSLVPGKLTTSASYFFVSWRKNRKKTQLMRAYRERLCEVGTAQKPFLMNIEELATLWHFPDISVKTPLIKKADAKRAEPPSSLPFEDLPITGQVEQNQGIPASFGPVREKTETVVQHVAEGQVSRPITYDNKSFEERFAKDKPVHTADQLEPKPQPPSPEPPAQQTSPAPQPAAPKPEPEQNPESKIIEQPVGGPPSNLPV